MNFANTHTNLGPNQYLCFRSGYSYLRMMIRSIGYDKAKAQVKALVEKFEPQDQPLVTIGANCALFQEYIRIEEASQEHSQEFNNGLATAEGLIGFLGYKDGVIEIREEIRLSTDVEFVKGLKHALHIQASKS